ncbi:MAG TPA: glycogen synthase GlgA [Solimonas sp.]|nr:glycogen synthase GlgA [Solimonas sp.]
MKKILFVSSEVFPLAKTGGLADVSAALPVALAELGADLRVLLPAYRGLLGRLEAARRVCSLSVLGRACTVWEGTIPGQPQPPVWLLECAPLFDRPGDPYHDAAGVPHADNALRFGVFGAAAAQLALGRAGAGWQPDALHVNDWQGALACAWAAQAKPRPRIVFTIHNLSYQGHFGRDSFEALQLPTAWWHPEALEFWGGWQFLKAGLNFSDAITTVSPTYAREIQTPEYGHGLDGVLRKNRARLHGVLNGIDERVWDPAADPHLSHTYTAATVVANKRANKLQLQSDLGLARDGHVPLLGFIGRFAEQKGSDLLLEAGEELAALGVQLVVLGAGERAQEHAWADWAARDPQQVAVRIGYDEALAHRIEGAADIALMPSRFEPCGLNQMYSQRYGAIPVVRRTGGLADTVEDATPEALQARRASGVLFDDANVGGVLYGIRRALALRLDAVAWSSMQQAGMQRDFSWGRAARRYLQLYETA